MESKLDPKGTAAFLMAVLDNLAEGVVACNSEGVLTTFNRATREFHGTPVSHSLPPEEWASHYQLYYEDGKTLMSEKDIPLVRALAGEKIENVELVIDTGKRQRVVRCNGQAIFDERGTKLGAVVTMHDITELKLASNQIQELNRERELRKREKVESALVESEKRFRTLFEQSPLSVQLLSVDGRTIQVNSAWKKLWGFSDEFVENFIFKKYNMLEDPELVHKGIMPVIQNGFRGQGGKIPAIYYDVAALGEGRGRWVEGFIEPVLDDAGNVREVVLIHQDVSDKVEFEQELKAARDAAEESNRLKSAFLANMSHEIRTPLGAILGFTQLLKDPSLSRDEADEYLSIIDRSGKALTRIIDDILDLSKVEAGRLRIETVSVDTLELVREVCTLLHKQAEDRGILLEVVNQESPIGKVETDPARLRQILINLIGNALKFTQSGAVKAEVQVMPDREKPRFKISITDTGLGIPKDQQASLFQSFNQVDNSRTRQFGGTGLGLVLSRRLAEAMGGNVYLEASEPNKGSIFVVELPLSQKLTASKNEKPASPKISDNDCTFLGLRILAVDDLEDNRRLLVSFLQKKGAFVQESSNGEEAVNFALSQKFDLIFMDVQMPVMDGFKAIQTLRDSKYTGPIIALTAHAMNEERDRCLQVGANAHLSKPLDFEDLIRTTKEILQAQ